MQNKSFTLIELLVVIAIIGLMAAVVLVSMGGIQSKAKITKTLEFSQNIQRSLGAYAVGIWSFDEGSGAVAKDGSGYGNNGTINGATYTDDTPHKAIDRGAGKYALSFDGDDYVSVGGNSILNFTTGDFTIAAWIYPKAMGEYPDRYVFDRGWRNEHGYEFLIYRGTRALWFFTNQAGANQLTYTGDILSLNKWQFVVAARSGSYAEIYLNGQVVPATHGAHIDPAPTSIAGLIGQYRVGYPHFFNGFVDEVRIYQKALTFGQIKKLYSEGLENHQNLVIK